MHPRSTKLPSKTKAWHEIVITSGLDGYEYALRDADFRDRYGPGGKRPPPWPTATFDSINLYLGLEGDRKVSCPMEAFYLLTQHDGITRWSGLEPVLAQLREVDGCAALRIPEGAMAAVVEEVAEREPPSLVDSDLAVHRAVELFLTDPVRGSRELRAAMITYTEAWRAAPF